MLEDVKPVGNLVDGVLDIEDAFLIQIEHVGVVGHVAIGVDCLNGELQRLGHQIVNQFTAVVMSCVSGGVGKLEYTATALTPEAFALSWTRAC